MRIAIVGTISTGMLLFRRELVAELVTDGHEVFVFCCDYTAATRTALADLGATPVDYPLSRHGLSLLSDLNTCFSLYTKLKALNIDLVFSYFSKPVVYGTIAAVLARVPKRFGMIEGLGFAFTERPNPAPFKVRLVKFIQVMLYRLAFPFLERVVFLNADDRAELSHLTSLRPDRSSILGAIGVDLDRFAYAPAEKPVQTLRFIFVGRLLKDKGIQEYLAAAEKIKSEHPEAEFLVVGGTDPNPASMPISEVDRLSQRGMINYIGEVSDVSVWLAKSSVFVLPSYREGYPRSTQEALAIGRAIITTDVPGCRETVIDGLNGLIVPPFDTQSLYEAMLEFINHPELVNTMGTESRKLAEKNCDVKRANQRLKHILGLV